MKPYIVFIHFHWSYFNYIICADSEKEAIQKGIAHAKKEYGEDVYNRNINRIACRLA